MKDNKFNYHRDFTLPKKDEIFVFGSNLAGFHGAGSAAVARDYYGAQLGQGVGLFGRSYALPTKDNHIVTRDLDDIAESIVQFVMFTHQNPDLKFFVTRIGCGLAGLKDQDVAPLFHDCINCSFPEEWKQYLEPTQ